MKLINSKLLPRRFQLKLHEPDSVPLSKGKPISNLKEPINNRVLRKWRINRNQAKTRHCKVKIQKNQLIASLKTSPNRSSLLRNQFNPSLLHKSPFSLLKKFKMKRTKSSIKQRRARKVWRVKQKHRNEHGQSNLGWRILPVFLRELGKRGFRLEAWRLFKGDLWWKTRALDLKL